MRKLADARKLDKKHVSPKTLQMLLAGDLQTALDRPDMQFLHAQAKERRRMLQDALEDPAFYLQPEEKDKPKPDEAPPFQFGPAAPGSPQSPGSPEAPSDLANSLVDAVGMPGEGIQQTAGILNHFITKLANGEEEGYESPEHEAAEKLDPGKLQELVNFIVSQGKGIDDERFHSKAEMLGVEPHEAEEEMYRLIADLVGGKNDVISGGLAAGLPTEMFPEDQIAKGTEVELEHTSSPAVAEEISKDHLVEGDDYYEPRLENLEEEMEEDVAEGKADAVGGDTEKVEKNEKRKEEDVEKLDGKAAAFKYGFLMKLAEAGLRPSDLEYDLRKSFEKFGSIGGAVGGGARALADLLKGIVGGTLSSATGLAKIIGVYGLPILSGLGGYMGGKGYYDLTRPDDLTPEDVKRAERMALYKRLTDRAKSKTRKEKEPEGLDTAGDDAHKLIPATTGIEI